MPFKEDTYQINWTRLTRWLIPVLRRFPKMLAFLNALTSSVNELHTRFLTFRSTVLYRLGITPQVAYLQKLLNDRFDIVDKRIRIVKGIAYDGIPFWMKDEVKPQKFWRKSEGKPRVLYTKDETMMFTVDFIVQVPITVPFDINELTAYLDTEVLPSKAYKVQIV